MHRMVDSMQTEILKLRLQIAVIIDYAVCDPDAIGYHDREYFRDAAMELHSLSQLIEKNSDQCSKAFEKLVP